MNKSVCTSCGRVVLSVAKWYKCPNCGAQLDKVEQVSAQIGSPSRFLVTQEVEYQQIADVLETAWDQCGYWAHAEQLQSPPEWKYLGAEGKKYTHLIALNPGGWVRFETCEGEMYTLDLAAVQKGVQLLAEKYPRHFADMINDNHDADTADVFLQCCLFGEVVYG